MLTVAENELLTRTDPGTAMGETMRRYWIPALLAWEIPEPDCPPVRVQLLGEKLVAFRDTAGRIGLLEEFCPHRRVSLWLGRNEECGLRCVYHGWKFDVDGNCVDQMNEPNQFKEKIRIASYPTVELGGVIWAYMGPAELQPPLPQFEWTQVPESHCVVTKVWQECNWLQALEGGIDTSHAPILHRTLRVDAKMPGINVTSPFVRGKAPTLVVETTDYGYRYFGVRSLGDEGVHIRSYHFVLPFHQVRPSSFSQGQTGVAGHMWVPIDDENCIVWNWYYALPDEAPLNEEDRLLRSSGNGPQDVDFANEFRSRRTKKNNYQIDRQAQKTETFTGITGINVQDRAVQESMGPVVDRSKEHLGPADRAIIVARQQLLHALKANQEGGTPLGLAPTYYTIRAPERVLSNDIDWHETLLPEMYPEPAEV
jgi:phenylpropionate dioxygenase-like ring-hydroxylating dioxygenase large terminal subunit